MLKLQLDQAVEKAETPRSRRSSKGREVLLFLLQLQDCECEKQAGMTSPGLFWLFFCSWVGLQGTGTADNSWGSPGSEREQDLCTG